MKAKEKQMFAKEDYYTKREVKQEKELNKQENNILKRHKSGYIVYTGYRPNMKAVWKKNRREAKKLSIKTRGENDFRELNWVKKLREKQKTYI